MNYILIFNVCVYSSPHFNPPPPSLPSLCEVSCPSSRWFLIGSHPIAINQSEITCSTSSTFCPLHRIPSTCFPPFLHVPFLHLCIHSPLCSYPQFPLFPFSVALHFSFHYHFSSSPVSLHILQSHMLPLPRQRLFLPCDGVMCVTPLPLLLPLLFTVLASLPFPSIQPFQSVPRSLSVLG